MIEVLIDDAAQEHYDVIWEYILARFGYRVAKEFEKKVELLIDILEQFPEVGIKQKSQKNLYALHLTSQTKVFYYYDSKIIVIIAFFDNRTNPKSVP